jgi:hypothetical protein
MPAIVIHMNDVAVVDMDVGARLVIICKSYSPKEYRLKRLIESVRRCVIPNVWNKSMWETRPSKNTQASSCEPSDISFRVDGDYLVDRCEDIAV